MRSLDCDKMRIISIWTIQKYLIRFVHKMLKNREKYHPLYFSAVVGNFYKGREQSRSKIPARFSTTVPPPHRLEGRELLVHVREVALQLRMVPRALNPEQ